MARKTKQAGTKSRRRTRSTPQEPPIPLTPVDLLAGLGPGLDLVAHDLPAGIAGEHDETTAAATTVTEVGKQLRSGDAVVRRLIRTSGMFTNDARRPTVPPREPDRAGVVPRTPDKPGE